MDLSLVEQIRIKRILDNRNNIDFKWLMMNPNVTLAMIDFMLKNNVAPDDITGCAISRSPNITMHFIKRRYPFLDWDWEYISSCLHTLTKMSLTDVIRNNHLPWDWNYIWASNVLSLEDVVQGRLKAAPENLLDYTATSCCCFTDLLAAYDGNLKETISRCPKNSSVPFQCMIDYGLDHFKNDGYFLLRMRFDPIESIIPYPELYPYCAQNTTVTEEIIKAHPDIQWYLTGRYKCHSDIQTLIKEIDTSSEHLQFDQYFYLSLNLNLTLQHIRDNPQIHFDWKKLSESLRDLTFQVLGDTTDPLFRNWNIFHASMNPWLLEVPEEEIQECARKIIASNKIKRAFKQSIANPGFLLCRKRLQREFEEQQMNL